MSAYVDKPELWRKRAEGARSVRREIIAAMAYTIAVRRLDGSYQTDVRVFEEGVAASGQISSTNAVAKASRSGSSASEPCRVAGSAGALLTLSRFRPRPCFVASRCSRVVRACRALPVSAATGGGCRNPSIWLMWTPPRSGSARAREAELNPRSRSFMVSCAA
jgi:hypothetical protein